MSCPATRGDGSSQRSASRVEGRAVKRATGYVRETGLRKAKARAEVESRRAAQVVHERGKNYTSHEDQYGIADEADYRDEDEFGESLPLGKLFVSSEDRYRRMVAEAWRDEVRSYPRVYRDAWEKRIRSFLDCGSKIVVRSCDACGETRPGSGSLSAVKRTCKTRCCARCGITRARNEGDFIENAFDAIPEVDDYEWQLVVMTIKYDPTNPADLRVPAIRSRAILAAKLAKSAWKELLGVDGAAMFRATEIGTQGHVHVNLTYYGPEVDKAKLDALAAAVDCRAGFTHVQPLNWDFEEGRPGVKGQRKKKRVKTKDPRGSKAAVKRATEYVRKSPTGLRAAFNEDFITGQNGARIVNPVLLARWEIATSRIQLTQRYGALRRLKFDEFAPLPREDDSELPCQLCGTVGEWRSVHRNTGSYTRWCHDQGLGALERSRWKPCPEEAEPVVPDERYGRNPGLRRARALFEASTRNGQMARGGP